jgi:hypothetical protein
LGGGSDSGLSSHSSSESRLGWAANTPITPIEFPAASDDDVIDNDVDDVVDDVLQDRSITSITAGMFTISFASRFTDIIILLFRQSDLDEIELENGPVPVPVPTRTGAPTPTSASKPIDDLLRIKL